MKRFNLVLTPEVAKRVERLQTRTGAASVTEVLRRALSVYDDLTATDSRIILRDASGREREIILVG